MSKRKADQIVARNGAATGAQFNAYFAMTIVFAIFKHNHIVDWPWMAVLTPLVIGAIAWVVNVVVTATVAHREERKP
jgi:hypothetical protein